MTQMTQHARSVPAPCFSPESSARSSPRGRTRAWSATSCCWRGRWIRSGKAEGNYLVAIDTVDAGVGETVLIVSGSSARMAAGMKDCPVDAVVVGIIDSRRRLRVTAMQMARVIGDVVATRKDPAFAGITAAARPAARRRRRSRGPAAGRRRLGGRRRRRARVLRARQGSAAFPSIPSRCPPMPASSASSITGRRRAMILARVVGQVVSTHKRPQFEGAKLLLVQPETPQGEPPGQHAAGHRLGGRRLSASGCSSCSRAAPRGGARQEAGAGGRRNHRHRRSGGRRVTPQMTRDTGVRCS